LQVRRLVESLRELAGRDDVPILIDQEGGRVQRLAPPVWPAFPPLSRYGALWKESRQAALQVCYQEQYRLAQEVAALGITVNCTPVLDVPVAGAHPVIGDRALSDDIEAIASLGAMVLKAHRDAGVAGVIKHIPGHGRAPADSHETLPVVDASADALDAVDVQPFRALAGQATWAMTAHVLYPAWDAQRVATTSPWVIENIIRQKAGFSGILVSDDITMKALGGSMVSRAQACLAAGCDVVLHCSGDFDEMRQLAAGDYPVVDTLPVRLAQSLFLERNTSWVA
jgi:beta-N-acetylhexosaminidase